MAEEFDAAMVAGFRVELIRYLNRRAKRIKMDDADREVDRIILLAETYEALDDEAARADFLKQLSYEDFIRVDVFLRLRPNKISSRATEPFDHESAPKRQKGTLLGDELPNTVKDTLALKLNSMRGEGKYEQLIQILEKMLSDSKEEQLLAEKEEEQDIDATSAFLDEFSDPRVPPRRPSTMHGRKSGSEPASEIFAKYLEDERVNAADNFKASLKSLPSNVRSSLLRRAKKLHEKNASLREQILNDAIKERLEDIRLNGLPGRDGASSSSAASSSYGYGSLGAAGEAFAGEASESSPERRPSRKGLASAAREAGDARSTTRSSRISAFPRYDEGIDDPELQIAIALSRRELADDQRRRTAESRPKGKGKASSAASSSYGYGSFGSAGEAFAGKASASSPPRRQSLKGPSSSSAASSSYGYDSLGETGEAFAGEASASSPPRRPSSSSGASSSYGYDSLGAAGEAFAGEASASSPQERPSRKGLASAAREAVDARSTTRSSRISAFPRYDEGVYDPEFQTAIELSRRDFADEERRRTAESRPKGKGKASASRPPSGGKSRRKPKTRRLSARTKRR